MENQDALQKDNIYAILFKEPETPASSIALTLGCTERYAYLIRAEFKQALEDEKKANAGFPVRGTKTALVLCDGHAPHINEEALYTALEEGKKAQPSKVVINGDWLNCDSISFWQKDPTGERFPEEVRIAEYYLAKVSEAFPDAEKIYIEGNHELRLRSYLWNHADQLYGLEALTIPKLLNFEKQGWTYVQNVDLLQKGLQPYSLGKLYLLHGHEMRVSFGAVNMPRLYLQKAQLPVLVGHHHTTQEYMARRLDHTYTSAYCVGGLCNLNPSFMPTNNWNAGFALVHWDADGDFRVENKKIIGGRVL